MTLATLLVLAQLASSHGGTTPSASIQSPTAAGGLSWTLPKGWIGAPSSSMRVATYRTPAAPGDKEGGEVAVFYFGPGQGGGTDANVERWFAQMSPEAGSKKPSRSQMKVGAISVTLCNAEGTYSGGMMGSASAGPEKGYALEGAIAEGPQGPVFFKLTGPKKSVEKAKAGFDALVKSLRPAS